VFADLRKRLNAHKTASEEIHVVVDAEAERDLDDIAAYIAEHDSVDRAIVVATRIEQSIAALTAFPNRGIHPKELLDYGNRDFREIYFKPYRILYRVLTSRCSSC